MKKAPYIKDKDYDENFEKIVSWTKDSLINKDDDFLIMCVGTTGTGKSSLMLHAMDLFLGDESSVKYIGLHRADFATALQRASTKNLPRFCCNDEANISKRDSLTKYNKDLIDLYMSIRGKQIFHWWNNPSLDMIDKHFIEERIKAVIFITTKEVNRPRIYYYFRKRDLLQIWNKYSDLKLQTLKRICGEYAFYRGWFRQYNGKLWKDYLEKKDYRMDDKISDFYNKYGKTEGMLTTVDITKKTGICSQTLYNYIKKIERRKLLTEDELKRTITGRRLYHQKILPIIEDMAKSKYQKVLESKKPIFKNEKNDL